MYKLKREFSFCYGHRLLNHPGKCRNLHGHNGKAVITLGAEHLDALGMVVDFSDVKRMAGAWIDEHLDHRLLLHRDDPALPHLRLLGEPVTVLEVNPTAENIAKLIFDELRSQGMQVLEVQLWETETCAVIVTAPGGGPPEASGPDPALL
jgi:6-pyruvoyltetrahydropterin/6-carboxytetrahydropterin synthase